MKIKHISALFFLAGATAFGQIKNNIIPTVEPASNAFLDASENSVNFTTNIGRGLLFPQTDLSTFKLDLAAADGINYPTFFDGMLVFNTKEGGSTTDTNIQTTDNLERGFYYFSNPEGVNNQGIAEGQWVKLCGCSTSGTGGGTTPGTGGGSTPGTGTGGTAIDLPPEVLLGNGVKIIPSVYDNDYLPYTTPTNAATYDVAAADGTTDPVVDIQGVVPVAGITVKIPVTMLGNGPVTLPAFTSGDLVIPAEHTQDGVSRAVILEWPQYTLTSSTKEIVATIKAKGGDLNIKKLDINKGIGNDSKGVLLGSIEYPGASNGNKSQYDLRIIAGIPDRHFGDGKHDFLYLPMTIGGKTFLNYNLGAKYADTHSPDFNLGVAKNATQSKADPKTWGSYFQWQRAADGHEFLDAPTQTSKLHTWFTMGVNGKRVIVSTGVERWNDAPYDPTNPSYTSLWKAGGINNPCPDGFHVPSLAEGSVLKTAHDGGRAVNLGGGSNVNNSAQRNINMDYENDRGSLWTSDKRGAAEGEVIVLKAINGSKQHADGYQIRCIQSGQ